MSLLPISFLQENKGQVLPEVTENFPGWDVTPDPLPTTQTTSFVFTSLYSIFPGCNNYPASMDPTWSLSEYGSDTGSGYCNDIFKNISDNPSTINFIPEINPINFQDSLPVAASIIRFGIPGAVSTTSIPATSQTITIPDTFVGKRYLLSFVSALNFQLTYTVDLNRYDTEVDLPVWSPGDGTLIGTSYDEGFAFEIYRGLFQAVSYQLVSPNQTVNLGAFTGGSGSIDARTWIALLFDEEYNIYEPTCQNQIDTLSTTSYSNYLFPTNVECYKALSSNFSNVLQSYNAKTSAFVTLNESTTSSFDVIGTWQNTEARRNMFNNSPNYLKDEHEDEETAVEETNIC